jgi:hypothetical protein
LTFYDGYSNIRIVYLKETSWLKIKLNWLLIAGYIVVIVDHIREVGARAVMKEAVMPLVQ